MGSLYVLIKGPQFGHPARIQAGRDRGDKPLPMRGCAIAFFFKVLTDIFLKTDPLTG
jgi:hypothetical protein